MAGKSSTQTLEGVPPMVARRTKNTDTVLGGVYVATVAIVSFLVFVPLIALIYGSLRTAAPGAPEGTWTLANYAGLASPGVLASIWTTLYVGLVASVLCIAIGTAITLIVHRTDFRHGTLITALIGISFYFPSFILAMAWIIIGSPGGVFNALLGSLGLSALKVDIYSVSGIILVMVLHQVPFVYLTLRGPIISMDGSFEEAARVAGARPVQVLLRVTLPLLSYSLLSSFILTFVLTIEQFAIPAMIGMPGHINVLATQLYLLVRFTPADYGLAAAVGLTLSAITALAIWGQRRVVKGGRLTTISGKAGRPAVVPLKGWKWPAYFLCFGFVTLGLVVPMAILIYTSLLSWFTANPFQGTYTLEHYSYIWRSATTMRSFQNTLVVSGVGAALGVCLGLFSSYFTQRLRPRGYNYLDSIVTMPFGVPGIVLGLGLLWAYAYLPLPLYGTLTVMVIAYITRFLPYASETISGQMVQIDKSLEEAAWVAGSTRLVAVRRILLPILSPSLQGAYFLLFMAFFREISSAVLLYTSKTAVISVSIWAFFEQANWGQASALSVVATVIIFVAMSLILRLMPTARR